MVSAGMRHDFRRTAVRSLERAGVLGFAAMRMVGHKTQSIYSRHAIVDESMLGDGAENVASPHAHEAQAAWIVVPKAGRPPSGKVRTKATG